MEKNLFLPKTNMSLNVKFDLVKDVLHKWTGDLYHHVNLLHQNNAKKPFFLLSGPPYANGEAHLGHVLNQVLKDLVVKSKWLEGQSVFYQPAWDCYGLPLELLAEKKYGKLEAKAKKEKCKSLALKGVAAQKKTFKQLGVLADWNNPLLTLSNTASQATYNSLLRLLEKGLLSYEDYPVHMCPVCQSSLAEAELESKEALQTTVYFTFVLNDKAHKPLKALVWTSTPWTVLMNQALAFNENLEYLLLENTQEQLVVLADFYNANVSAFSDYEKLGLWDKAHNYQALNSQNQWVPLDTALFVENKGTGFVHVVASHGKDDFEFCKKLNMLPQSWVGNDGKFHNSPYEFLNEKKLGDVAPVVVQYLKDTGYLFSVEEKMMTKDLCWRHKSPCFVKTSKQLFLNLPSAPKLAENDFNYKLSLMMQGRQRWCLSRQRTWGNKLLLWVKDGQLSENNVAYLQAFLKQDKNTLVNLTKQLETEGWQQLEDVLDVWWDSGNLSNLYHDLSCPTPDLVVEGKDQFRGWFQSLTWLSYTVNDKEAFKKGLVHGFVLNKDKEKFAKSKGNAPNLKVYLKKFGPDVLRLWVAGSSYQDDVVFSEEKLSEMEVVYKRFRGTLRYLLSNLTHFQEVENLQLGEVELKVLNEMQKCESEVKKNLSEYNFHHALNKLYEFCDKELSNFYFEYAKPVLYLSSEKDEVRVRTLQTFNYLFLKLVKLFSVLTPFLAEEGYAFYQEEVLKCKVSQSVFVLPSLKLDLKKSSEVWEDFHTMKSLVSRNVEVWVKEKKCTNKLELSVKLDCTNKVVNLLDTLKVQKVALNNLFGVSEFTYVENNKQEVSLENLKLKGYFKCKRCWEYKVTENCPCSN